MESPEQEIMNDQITIAVTKSLKERIERAAEADDRPVSAFVRRIVEKAIAGDSAQPAESTPANVTA